MAFDREIYGGRFRFFVEVKEIIDTWRFVCVSADSIAWH